ncbi:hypothetical protein HMPREF9120_01927 [Neisseria sp. oral taxon 020 str. F0370]|nr:hypothetical protein HMPREF9120_01927 [Neisseria sp. oral taxon 020 str. F0370]
MRHFGRVFEPGGAGVDGVRDADELADAFVEAADAGEQVAHRRVGQPLHGGEYQVARIVGHGIGRESEKGADYSPIGARPRRRFAAQTMKRVEAVPASAEMMFPKVGNGGTCRTARYFQTASICFVCGTEVWNREGYEAV